uniref:Uncharacterized protein n=1 Tax=Cacopsylla melanoneura TaxID=428564 RepID=A0A8D8QB13_9HEMI
MYREGDHVPTFTLLSRVRNLFFKSMLLSRQDTLGLKKFPSHHRFFTYTRSGHLGRIFFQKWIEIKFPNHPKQVFEVIICVPSLTQSTTLSLIRLLPQPFLLFQESSISLSTFTNQIFM